MKSNRFASHRRVRGRRMRLAVAAIVMIAAGFQFADGAESTMRVLGSRDEVKPPVADVAVPKRQTIARRDSIVQRESTVRVATASSSVLGRQESKLVERRVSEPAAPSIQAEEFTTAIREAAALRDAIKIPTSAPVTTLENKSVANRTAPPANMSALTISKPSPAPAASVPSPTATASVPVIRITSPAASVPQPVESTPAPVVRVPQQVAAAPAPMISPPAPIAPAPVAVVPAREATTPAPSPIVRAPAPLVPAPSPVVRAPAPVVPAPSPVVRAPASVAPAPPQFAVVPAPIAEEPVHVAQVPAAVVHTPRTMIDKMPAAAGEEPPVASIAAAHATYHPHSKPAPPTDGYVVPETCLTESAPEEYDISGAPGCAYGPGQSGAQHLCGVDCGVYGAPCAAGWNSAHCIPWSLFGPGEYVGPSRTEHVSSYYLRVNDLLTLTYISSRQKMGERYRLGIGDRLMIELSVDESLKREVEIQPDGEITLPIVGEIMAAGKTVKELRDDLIDVFKEAQREPQITVTPLMVNSAQQEIIRAVTAASGSNGQSINLKVTPEGTIQVPGVGSVYVQGLTLEELRTELEARYNATFGSGLMISPALTERAISYVFVGGEVKSPNRYTLEGPTTATQAISSLAGGWNIGGNLHQVVVFRRDENWCLKAIKIDVRAPLYGNDPCPVNDVWLRDNDLVIVPKSRILCATDIINLYMTRGVYAAFPVSFFQDLSNGSTVVVP